MVKSKRLHFGAISAMAFGHIEVGMAAISQYFNAILQCICGILQLFNVLLQNPREICNIPSQYCNIRRQTYLDKALRAPG